MYQTISEDTVHGSGRWQLFDVDDCTMPYKLTLIGAYVTRHGAERAMAVQAERGHRCTILDRTTDRSAVRSG